VATNCTARGILYAPDYAINSGGLMVVSMELSGYDERRASRMMRNIYYVMKKILFTHPTESMPEYPLCGIGLPKNASLRDQST
jgi:leucine dehydrogenase